MLEMKVMVLMNEMTAIRNEINATKETIHSIMNFFFILIGAEVSLFIAIWKRTVDFNDFFIRILILSIPWLFICLSFYHTECVMRIHMYISYIDVNIRGKIKELLGDPLLNSKSKEPTNSIIDLFSKRSVSARLAYISKLGIKLMSMLIPCIFYFCMIQEKGIKATFIENVMLSVDFLLIIILFFTQHD